MSEPSHVRVSDEERERVAAELREHFAQGRLDTDELEERLSRAYGARTMSELQVLRTDLPHLPATRQADLAERRAALARQLIQQTGGALAPFLVCTAIWLATGANGSFWPIWILIVVLIPLIRNGWKLYGPAPELEHVEQELAAKRRDG